MAFFDLRLTFVRQVLANVCHFLFRGRKTCIEQRGIGAGSRRHGVASTYEVDKVAGRHGLARALGLVKADRTPQCAFRSVATWRAEDDRYRKGLYSGTPGCGSSSELPGRMLRNMALAVEGRRSSRAPPSVSALGAGRISGVAQDHTPLARARRLRLLTRPPPLGRPPQLADARATTARPRALPTRRWATGSRAHGLTGGRRTGGHGGLGRAGCARVAGGLAGSARGERAVCSRSIGECSAEWIGSAMEGVGGAVDSSSGVQSVKRRSRSCHSSFDHAQGEQEGGRARVRSRPLALADGTASALIAPRRARPHRQNLHLLQPLDRIGGN